MKDWKALKSSVLRLVVRLPRISLPSKKRHTSGTMDVPLGCWAAASSMAVMRFSLASERSWPTGSCEPVKIMGLESPLIMYERAEAE